MKIALLDDYLKIARDYADWSRLPQDCELTVFNQSIGDEDAVAAALEPFDIVCLMRDGGWRCITGASSRIWHWACLALAGLASRSPALILPST